nr:MAG TPA: hypothetical protein [Caudoviricetes sp.]
MDWRHNLSLSVLAFFVAILFCKWCYWLKKMCA